MKITVEHYDEKVSIETEKDDLNFEDFTELLRRIAVGMGYPAITVDEFFNERT
jgi:hypothetical protein